MSASRRSSATGAGKMLPNHGVRERPVAAQVASRLHTTQGTDRSEYREESPEKRGYPSLRVQAAIVRAGRCDCEQPGSLNSNCQ